MVLKERLSWRRSTRPVRNGASLRYHKLFLIEVYLLILHFLNLMSNGVHLLCVKNLCSWWIMELSRSLWTQWRDWLRRITENAWSKDSRSLLQAGHLKVSKPRSMTWTGKALSMCVTSLSRPSMKSQILMRNTGDKRKNDTPFYHK